MFIFALIDALGWEFIENDPFMDDIFVHKNKLSTVYGYSSGAIPSILTGSFPRDHGNWNLFSFSPETSPFSWMQYFPFLDREKVYTNKYYRELIRRACKLKAGYTGTFSLPLVPFESLSISPVTYFKHFDICEKKWIYAEKSFEKKKNLFDILKSNSIRYGIYSYNKYNDKQVFSTVTKDIADDKYDFYFLYFTEVDHFLHFHRDDPDLIKEKIQWYEKKLTKLYNLADDKSKGDCSFMVCSDHGMAEITEHIDLITMLAPLGLKFGDDYLAMFDSTMARFWFFNEKAESIMSNFLNTLSCGKILTKEDEKQLGINFPNQEFGQLFFALNEGLIIHPGMMGSWLPKGMHGYLPECSSSDAIFLSNWHPTTKPLSLVDILQSTVERVGCRLDMDS